VSCYRTNLSTLLSNSKKYCNVSTIYHFMQEVCNGLTGPPETRFSQKTEVITKTMQLCSMPEHTAPIFQLHFACSKEIQDIIPNSPTSTNYSAHCMPHAGFLTKQQSCQVCHTWPPCQLSHVSHLKMLKASTVSC